MINFKIITRILGILLMLETMMLMLCSGISFYYQDEALTDFWISAAITAGTGLLLYTLGKGGDRQLTRRDGYDEREQYYRTYPKHYKRFF